MSTAPAPQQISPIRKAAILLVTLGEESSAELMQQLSPAEVKKLAEETARLKDISGEQMEAVLREFYLMSANTAKPKGGPEFAQRMLGRALGPDGAKRLLEPSVDGATAGFAKLEPLVKSDAAQVARSLNSEHPQTIALIIAHLPQEQAVSLLTALPPESRGDVALRMAGLDQIAPDVVAQVAEAVGERFSQPAGISREAYHGLRFVADLCNLLDPTISDEILQNMEAASPETADRLRQIMFVFEDILRLDDTAMGEVNSRVDRKTLAMALKGTSEQIKEHFTKKMSSRARDMFFEDLDALGPVKVKDVEVAQQEVIAVVRLLEQEGVVSTRAASAGGGGDGYVS